MVMEPRPKKLLDQLHDVIRLKHYTYRTEETYGSVSEMLLNELVDLGGSTPILGKFKVQS